MGESGESLLPGQAKVFDVTGHGDHLRSLMGELAANRAVFDDGERNLAESLLMQLRAKEGKVMLESEFLERLFSDNSDNLRGFREETARVMFSEMGNSTGAVQGYVSMLMDPEFSKKLDDDKKVEIVSKLAEIMKGEVEGQIEVWGGIGHLVKAHISQEKWQELLNQGGAISGSLKMLAEYLSSGRQMPLGMDQTRVKDMIRRLDETLGLRSES